MKERVRVEKRNSGDGYRIVLFHGEKDVVVLSYLPGGPALYPFPYNVSVHETRTEETGDSCCYTDTGYCKDFRPPTLAEYIKCVEMAAIELTPIANMLDLASDDDPWHKFLVGANASLEILCKRYGMNDVVARDEFRQIVEVEDRPE